MATLLSRADRDTCSRFGSGGIEFLETEDRFYGWPDQLGFSCLTLDVEVSPIAGEVLDLVLVGSAQPTVCRTKALLAVCWDLIANEIAKARYMSDGQLDLPLVIRPPMAAASTSAPSTARASRTGR